MAQSFLRAIPYSGLFPDEEIYPGMDFDLPDEPVEPPYVPVHATKRYYLRGIRRFIR